MKKSYFDSGGNDTELIAVLNAISHVSARMARNMTILAQQRQSEKGERRYEQNERSARMKHSFLKHVNFKLMKSLESSEFLLIW